MKTTFFHFLLATSLGVMTGVSAPAGLDVPKAQAASAGTPKIHFAAPAFDFGKLSAGEVVKHNFVFTNTGTAPLEILDVKPGCGCTTAGTWDRIVAPGKTGSIPLQFNSANFSGRVTKAATVTSNDPEAPIQTLQISGTVWKAIEIIPSMAFFSVSGESQAKETKIIRIVNNDEEPITLSDLQSTNPVFQVELKTVKPGKEFALHVTAVPPFNTRVVSSAINVKTSSPRTPLLQATAYLTVQPAVVVSPAQLYLTAGLLATPATQRFTIRNTGTNSLALSDVRVNVPELQVTVEESQPGKLFNLAVKIPAGFEVQPNQKLEVTAKSNHPQFPTINVPIIATRPPPSRTPPPAASQPARPTAPAGLPGPVAVPPAKQTSSSTATK